MLTFTQINLHKAAQAMMLVGRGMEGSKQSITLMTEPYTFDNKVAGLPRGTRAVYARQGGVSPRACIVSSMDVKLTAMDNWCRRDCAVALARIGGAQTIIVSLYLDITLEVQPDWLDNLMHMINGKNYPIIMGMDSNAHSTMFGPTNNARGAALEDFILQYGLNVENFGNVPTFEIIRGANHVKTYIDVTLTRDLPVSVQDWHVCQDYNASDHNTILFQVQNKGQEPELVRPWSRADWKVFEEELKCASYDIPKDMSMKKLDKLVTKIYRILEAALDKACPRVSHDTKVGKSHWATEKHDQEKSKVNALYRAAKKSGSQEAWQQYKEADKKFKRMCRIDKNKAWRKYKECIQSEKEMAQLAKSAQWEERRDINVLTRPDGSSTDPGTETINLLTETHFPAATDTKHVTYNNRRNLSVEDIQGKYKDWIDKQKIKSALAGFEKKKSPGPDGLKPLIFEHFPDELITCLSYTSPSPRDRQKSRMPSSA